MFFFNYKLASNISYSIFCKEKQLQKNYLGYDGVRKSAREKLVPVVWKLQQCIIY